MDTLINQTMIRGSHFRGHNMQDWAKNTYIEPRFCLPYNSSSRVGGKEEQNIRAADYIIADKTTINQ